MTYKKQNEFNWIENDAIVLVIVNDSQNIFGKIPFHFI